MLYVIIAFFYFDLGSFIEAPIRGVCRGQAYTRRKKGPVPGSTCAIRSAGRTALPGRIGRRYHLWGARGGDDN